MAIVGVSRDITDRRISRSENETISWISQIFLSSYDHVGLYEGIPAIISGQFNYPLAGILKYEAATDEIVPLGVIGILWDSTVLLKFPATNTITGTVLKTGKSFLKLDISDQHANAISEYINIAVKTYICEPIFIGNTVFGAICLGDTRIRSDAPRISRTIRIIADYLSRELTRRQMDKTLRESEELTRNLMSSVNEGIVIFDTGFRVLLWNRFMEDLTGIPADESVGKIVDDFLPNVKIEVMAVENDLERVLEGESFMSEEMTFDFPRSGRSGWLIGQYTPLKNSENRIIGIILSIRDITRRKMVELSLGKTQEDLRETLDATTDGIWTWNVRTNELYYSPRFYTMLGYEPGEFPARFSEYKKLIHPDDIRQTMVIIRDYMNSKDKDFYENEYRLKTKSGKYRWIYAKARVVARGPDGRVLRMIGNHEDIAERKMAEERLRGQLAVNMALAGLSGSIISQTYSIDDIAIIVLEYSKLLTESEDGYVSEINRETGDNVILSPAVSMEGGRLPIVNGGAADHHDGHVPYAGLWGYALNTRQAFFTNAPRDHPSWIEPPPGHVEIRRFLSVPIMLNNELVGQITLVNPSRDYKDNDIVTVRRLGSLYAMAINRIRNEEKLKDSLYEKEVLIKELHHRVKNNMQVVSSLLALQSRKVDDARYRAYFEESQNRIHAMAMVHEKLYRSNDMARVNFSEYIKELARHLFFSYNVNSQTVRLTIDVEEVFLGIDTAIPCAMIINELVSNAIKHAFPNGRRGEMLIRLVKNNMGKHELTVRDDGVGLPDGFAAANTNSLGMQIVQSLTKQIKGTITFDQKSGTGIIIVF